MRTRILRLPGGKPHIVAVKARCALPGPESSAFVLRGRSKDGCGCGLRAVCITIQDHAPYRSTAVSVSGLTRYHQPYALSYARMARRRSRWDSCCHDGPQPSTWRTCRGHQFEVWEGISESGSVVRWSASGSAPSRPLQQPSVTSMSSQSRSSIALMRCESPSCVLSAASCASTCDRFGCAVES